MISTFGRLIKIEETAYPLFVAFSNPWLLRKEMVDKVYSKVKGSEQPEVVNQFVEYLNESGFAEDYIDVIIDMSKHIHNLVDQFSTLLSAKKDLPIGLLIYSSVVP